MRFKCNTFPSALKMLKGPLLRRIVAEVGLLGMLAFTALAQSGQTARQAIADNSANGAVQDAERNHNSQLRTPEEPGNAQSENAAEIQRRQIADQSAILLQLAKELKTAVDNSDACTLSIHIVRKADSIVKLARGVKEEMKRTVAQR